MWLESEKNPNKLVTSLNEAIKVGVRASSECDFNKKTKKQVNVRNCSSGVM